MVNDKPIHSIYTVLLLTYMLRYFDVVETWIYPINPCRTKMQYFFTNFFNSLMVVFIQWLFHQDLISDNDTRSLTSQIVTINFFQWRFDLIFFSLKFVQTLRTLSINAKDPSFVTCYKRSRNRFLSDCFIVI